MPDNRPGSQPLSRPADLSSAAPLHHVSPVGKGGPPRADRLELGFLLVVQRRIEPVERGAHWPTACSMVSSRLPAAASRAGGVSRRRLPGTIRPACRPPWRLLSAARSGPHVALRSGAAAPRSHRPAIARPKAARRHTPRQRPVAAPAGFPFLILGDGIQPRLLLVVQRGRRTCPAPAAPSRHRLSSPRCAAASTRAARMPSARPCVGHAALIFCAA